MIKTALLSTAALPLLAATALAQAAVPETDISSLTEPVLQAALALLTGVLIWAGAAARAWLATRTTLANSEIADALQRRFNEAVARSMGYAETYLKTHIDLADGKAVINNEFVREAADYLKTNWPDMTKDMGLDKLTKAIIARLPTGPLTENAEILAQSGGKP